MRVTLLGIYSIKGGCCGRYPLHVAYIIDEINKMAYTMVNYFTESTFCSTIIENCV